VLLRGERRGEDQRDSCQSERTHDHLPIPLATPSTIVGEHEGVV